jgi:hypothetical protein
LAPREGERSVKSPHDGRDVDNDLHLVGDAERGVLHRERLARDLAGHLEAEPLLALGVGLDPTELGGELDLVGHTPLIERSPMTRNVSSSTGSIAFDRKLSSGLFAPRRARCRRPSA